MLAVLIWLFLLHRYCRIQCWNKSTHTLIWRHCVPFHVMIKLAQQVVLKKLSQYLCFACLCLNYIWWLSSFRVPAFWFMTLAAATCHIQYTFLSLYQFVFTRKRTKHRNTFSYRTKMATSHY